MEILMPVETDEQYEEALRRVSELEGKEPAPDTKEGREFASLLKLIDEYEKQTYGEAEAPPPAVVVEQRMKRLGLTQAELSEKTDIPPPRISEITNGKRLPSRRQIEKLSRFFEIPADLLVQEGDQSVAAE